MSTNHVMVSVAMVIVVILTFGWANQHYQWIEIPFAKQQEVEDKDKPRALGKMELLPNCDPRSFAHAARKFIQQEVDAQLSWINMPPEYEALKVPLIVVDVVDDNVLVAVDPTFMLKHVYLPLWIRSGHIKPTEKALVLTACSATLALRH